MAAVNFFAQEIDFVLSHPRKTSSWIKRVIKSEGEQLKSLNFIFCSDNHLYEINLKFLNHKTFTDIITFDTSDKPGLIEGDIFISVERIKENAINLKVPFEDELHRVIIHGVLHLLGYSDKTPSNQKKMRKKEDAYLSLR